MSQRRLMLLALSLTTVASVPSRAAQTADVMTPVPFDVVLSALDLEQTVPDPSCVTQCTNEFNRYKAAADNALARGMYFAGTGGNNCTEAKGQPKCVEPFFACDNACRPNDAACRAACKTTLQNCCHDNSVAWSVKNREQCVAQCPTVKGPVQPPLPPPPPAPKKPIDREAAWKSVVSSTAAMLQAFGGMQLDGMTPERFDAMRRELAFTQVSAAMMVHDATYGVLAGGNGRLWAVRNDGTRVLLAFPEPTGDAWADRDARERAVKRQTGLDDFQVKNLVQIIDHARDRKDLAPGTYYLCREFDNTSASSEHSSVRGTINGGGDYI